MKHERDRQRKDLFIQNTGREPTVVVKGWNEVIEDDERQSTCCSVEEKCR